MYGLCINFIVLRLMVKVDVRAVSHSCDVFISVCLSGLEHREGSVLGEILSDSGRG